MSYEASSRVGHIINNRGSARTDTSVNVVWGRIYRFHKSSYDYVHLFLVCLGHVHKPPHSKIFLIGGCTVGIEILSAVETIVFLNIMKKQKYVTWKFVIYHEFKQLDFGICVCSNQSVIDRII
jgi:hypothetical protein